MNPRTEARLLRERVLAAPEERLTLSRAEVLERLVPDAGAANSERDEDIARDPVGFASGLLAHQGLQARPALTAAPEDGAVQLRPSRRYALQGALAVTAIAALIGFAGFWAYGFAFLVFGGAICVLLAVRPDLAEHVPPQVPRGRLLGAGAALAAVLLAAVLVVLPVRLARGGADNGAAQAEALVHEADVAIDGGDYVTARAKLIAASAADNGVTAIDDVRDKLVVAQVQAALNEQARKEGVYHQAELAAAAGRLGAAIRLGRSIAGFRDIDALVADWRAQRRKAK